MSAITHGNVYRGYKLCRCARCQEESVCTPDNDFYTMGRDDDGPLYCAGCMLAIASKERNLELM
jgi:hypothetical protein